MLQSIGRGLLALLAVVLLFALAWSDSSDEATPAAGTSPAAEAATAATADVDTDKASKKKKRKRSKAAIEPPAAPAPTEAVEEVVFAENAFPPTIPDTDWHRDAWQRDDCRRCHETGVGEAPVIVHAGMAEVLMTAKCRSCHVLIPGTEPRPPDDTATDSIFARNAFPPMIPASSSHRTAWTKDDCLMCHESGLGGAPVVAHEGMPSILLTAKCRTCHVQVRADEAAYAVP